MMVAKRPRHPNFDSWKQSFAFELAKGQRLGQSSNQSPDDVQALPASFSIKNHFRPKN
jgi:hypothetical protein